MTLHGRVGIASCDSAVADGEELRPSGIPDLHGNNSLGETAKYNKGISH